MLHLFNRIGCILIILIVTGCSSKYPRLEVAAPLIEKGSCQIAVLPFVYQGNVPRGEYIFYKALTSSLTSIENLGLVPEGDVISLYNQLKLYRNSPVNESRIEFIGNRLNAQYVVSGQISRMREVEKRSFIQTDMTVSVNIHDGETGRLLWHTYHRRDGEEYTQVMHYGRVNTISGLARRMSEEIKDLWIEKGINQCIKK